MPEPRLNEMSMALECRQCHGSGGTFGNPCLTCNGYGRVMGIPTAVDLLPGRWLPDDRPERDPHEPTDSDYASEAAESARDGLKGGEDA